MSTEHRYCARYPIELKVQILYRNRRFFSAKGTNVSNHGMFLEVRNLTLPTGTMVELEMRTLGRDWLIAAIVVHQDQSGIGVMFRDLQPDLFQCLSSQIDSLSYRPAQIAVAENRVAQPSLRSADPCA